MRKISRLTIEDAIKYINELRGVEGFNWVSKNTLYKYTKLRKIKNYGRGNKALYDPKELEAVFGEKSSA